MILGFKDQFVPFVKDGSKTHTIRGGARWKAGMRADLYARPRQKDMRLLFRASVLKVEWIRIGPDYRIAIDGMELDEGEKDLFAWRDGFRRVDLRPQGAPESWGCFHEMMDFWRKTHDLAKKPFHGQIIHWDYAERFMDLPKKPKQRYCDSMMCSQYGEPVGRGHSCAP